VFQVYPLFPEIYEGKSITIKNIAPVITDYFSPKIVKGHWPREGKAAMAWSMVDRDIVYIYYQTALKKSKKEDDPEQSVLKPGNPIVWDVFNYILQRVK